MQGQRKHAIQGNTKISQHIKSGKLIKLYNNVPFISECFYDQKDSQQHQKVSRRHQTRNSQNGPNVFLSSSLFFLQTGQLSIALMSDDGSCTKQHFTLSSAPSHHFFHNSKYSNKALQGRSEASLGRHFVIAYTHVYEIVTQQLVCSCQTCERMNGFCELTFCANGLLLCYPATCAVQRLFSLPLRTVSQVAFATTYCHICYHILAYLIPHIPYLSAIFNCCLCMIFGISLLSYVTSCNIIL